MIPNRTTLRALLLAALPLLAAAGCEGQRSGLTEEQLGVMIDSLLPEIAEVSGLEVRAPVQFALQPRSEARAFIERQLDEEMVPGELEGSERAYKAYGLLPDTLDLRALMLELLTEQVVGYYDPPTGQLYVVEGADASTAGPVVAHELVHALQDQHTDLDSLVAPERGNDRQMAAQAAAEGQAMLVMLAMQAAQAAGQPIDIGALPDLGPMMRPALEAENEQFPVFQRSPRLIRETLIFPYIGGAGFVQSLHRNRTGDEVPVPFGALLPQSTEQILDPEGAFLQERDAPTDVELGPVPSGWSEIYGNTLGQLETNILLSERLASDAQAAATGWDGDRYVLLETANGAEALVWYTVWDDPAAADRFAATYRRWASQPVRTESGFGPGTVTRLDLDGRPLTRVIESRRIAPDAVEPPPVVSLAETPGG